MSSGSPGIGCPEAEEKVTVASSDAMICQKLCAPPGKIESQVPVCGGRWAAMYWWLQLPVGIICSIAMSGEFSPPAL